MIKNVLMLLCIIHSMVFFGQDDVITFPEKDGKIDLEQIVDVEGVPKDELFNRAKVWVIDSFKNEKYVTSTDDRELGEIKGSGIFTILKNQNVSFSFRVSVKENKYKYNIFDIIYLDNYNNKTSIDLQYYYDRYKSGKKLGKGITTKYVAESKEQIYLIITSLKVAMSSTDGGW